MAKRLLWFPMMGSYQSIVEDMQAESVKAAIGAAFQYFNDGNADMPSLDVEAKFLFRMLKHDIDEAKKHYAETVKQRKEAAAARWKNKGDSG